MKSIASNNKHSFWSDRVPHEVVLVSAPSISSSKLLKSLRLAFRPTHAEEICSKSE